MRQVAPPPPVRRAAVDPPPTVRAARLRRSPWRRTAVRRFRSRLRFGAPSRPGNQPPAPAPALAAALGASATCPQPRSLCFNSGGTEWQSPAGSEQLPLLPFL